MLYMKPDERDISTLRHIVKYCDEITGAVNKHNLTLDIISGDTLYKNALAMNILQIGELTSILSDDFRNIHDSMPWNEIKRMRNKAAHHYWTFDVNILWETVTEDIEPLRKYCEECLAKYNEINN